MHPPFITAAFPAAPGSGNAAVEAGTIDVDVDGQYNSFPSLARTTDGKLHLVYRKGANHNLGGSYGVIKYRTSTNDGATWSAATTIADASAELLNCNDPSIALVASGRLLVTYNKQDAVVRRMHRIYSDNAGTSWSSEAQIPDPFTVFCCGPGPALLTSWGELLKPVYGQNTSQTYTTGLLRSTDNGATWGNFSVVAGPGSPPQGSINANTYRDWEEPHIIERQDGSLMVTIRTDQAFETFVSFSLDRGQQWSSPRFAVGGVGNPCPVQLTNGVIVMVNRQGDPSNPGGSDKRPNYSTSRDWGRTWETPAYLDTGLCEYGAAVEISPNRLAAVYSHETGVEFYAPADLVLRYLNDN